MSVRSIQKAFYTATYQRYEMVAPNIYLDWVFNEMDLLAIRRSGYIDEIEIKLSRADYLADFRKTVSNGLDYPDHAQINKHEALKEGIPHCNYFSFLMPEELSKKCEIPDYAGLYVHYVDNAGNGRIREEKRAPILHKRKLSDRLRYEVGRKMAFRYWHQQGPL